MIMYKKKLKALRNRSLITGGGLQNGRGGANEVLTIQKRGSIEKMFSHAEEGAQKVLG